ncbi:MAG: hypothetical protein IPP64_17170 [Bacteroidetes bacterium]|nr:hypothetical protein [Bacteroidota bacterium]
MINSFKFTFPTFDIDEPNEIILDVPSINNVGIQTSKSSDEKFVTASVNEIREMIVTEMISNVKQDLSKLTGTKA